MQTCPRCGSTIDAAFCGHCGAQVSEPREAARGSVRVQQGDKGVDRSQTHIDNSSHSSSQVDDHSVRQHVYADSSRREVHISADDNRRVKRSQWSISGSGPWVAAVAVVSLALFVVYSVYALRIVRESTSTYVSTPAVKSAAPPATGMGMRDPLGGSPGNVLTGRNSPSGTRASMSVSDGAPVTCGNLEVRLAAQGSLGPPWNEGRADVLNGGKLVAFASGRLISKFGCWDMTGD